MILEIHQESKTLVVKRKGCSAAPSKAKMLDCMAFLILLWPFETCCFEAQKVTESVSFGKVYLIQKFGWIFRVDFVLKVETCGITAGFKVMCFTSMDKAVT